MVCKMLSSKGMALISANPLWVRWQSTQEAFLQHNQPRCVSPARREASPQRWQRRAGCCTAVSQPCFQAVRSSRTAAFLL